MKISGKIVDIHLREVYPGTITISKGKVESVERTLHSPDLYILPGLIDSHIHIESSMVTPGAFALAAVSKGTTAVVSDPHEIANVLGVEGVEFMIQDSKKVPLKFFFGAPSCVPATVFETSGGSISSSDVAALLQNPDIKYLSEMMNFPGVIYHDNEVDMKLAAAANAGKPVDGHAPGLKGSELEKYVLAGISTDHECSTIEEAREKIALGMKILIREGSAARNLQELKGLITECPEMVMLCSDDLHPEMLRERHINKIVGGLIREGFNAFDVIRSATINPVEHYGLDAGLLREGDNADFIVVDALDLMNVKETWINGVKVYGEGKILFEYLEGTGVNRFNCSPVRSESLRVNGKRGKYRVIEAFEGELFTRELIVPWDDNSEIRSDITKDILKIVVKDRYADHKPAIGFIKGFKLKRGALASSVAHDSHNIIALGTNDADIAGAINEIVRMQGGLAVCHEGRIDSLKLDIGGIMTTKSVEVVANDYERLNNFAAELGTEMKAPFMTLSFMALLVIPELKLSDKGLFDGKNFRIVPLVID